MASDVGVSATTRTKAWMSLPVFINKNNRIKMFLMCGIAFYLGYVIPNHYHFVTPRLLALSPYDEGIPLMPWTIFIYMSEYVLFVSAYFMFRSDFNRNRYVCSFFGTLLFSMLFFIFWPTTYPREMYPIPTDTDFFTFQTFSFLRMVDDPSNSFPSLHVSCCFLAAFAFLEKPESRKVFWFYFWWAFLVAVSTLTTKQHYLVDAISGIVVSLTAYILFFKKTYYYPNNSSHRPG